MAVWYATINIDVPCFFCSIFDDSGSTMYPQRAGGSGCRPVKQIALSRALTESLQSRLTHVSGTRDSCYWSMYRDILPVDLPGNRAWIATIEEEDASIDYNLLQEFSISATTSEMLAWLRSKLLLRKIDEIVVVDLTLPQFTIPVVFVIAPGLEYRVENSLYTPGPHMRQFLIDWT
jgi:YcaO-like protein with predicted kinase domain